MTNKQLKTLEVGDMVELSRSLKGYLYRVVRKEEEDGLLRVHLIQRKTGLAYAVSYDEEIGDNVWRLAELPERRDPEWELTCQECLNPGRMPKPVNICTHCADMLWGQR